VQVVELGMSLRDAHRSSTISAKTFCAKVATDKQAAVARSLNSVLAGAVSKVMLLCVAGFRAC
jgi:hypothetical protein